MTTRAISYYPLSERFKRLVAGHFDSTPEFMAVGSIKNESVPKLLALAREGAPENVVVAIEFNEGRPLFAPLLFFACLTRGENICAVWPDGRLTSHSRLEALPLAVGLASGEVKGWLSYFASLVRAKWARHRSPPAAQQRRQILYLDANLAFGLAAGGSVGHTRGVIDALSSRGYEVTYASVKPTPTPLARQLSPSKPDTLIYPSELAYYLFNPLFDRLIERHAKEFPPAFIYQRLSLHNYSGSILRRRAGVPLIVEYNGSEVWTAQNWATPLQLPAGARAAESALLRTADLVVTVSKPLYDQLLERGVDEERIVLYPNCIDPALFSPERFSEDKRSSLRAQLQIGEDDLLITFIGTFGAWHGVDFLAEAIRHLVDSDEKFVRNNRLKFLLVGDGLKMADVQQTLSSSNYSPYIILTGIVPQDEAPLYLAISDIFVSPHLPNTDGTEFFGSPTKLFEYMAMERPIVASRLGQIGDVLGREGGDLAALYEPGDQAGFLEALKSVVTAPAAARERARRAREEVSLKYTWNSHVDAILDRAAELGLVARRSHGKIPTRPARSRSNSVGKS